MIAAGCSETSEPGVRLKVLPEGEHGPRLRFDCEGVSEHALAEAYRREMLGSRLDDGLQAAVTGYWGWQTTFSTYACGAPSWNYTVTVYRPTSGYEDVYTPTGEPTRMWLEAGWIRVDVYTPTTCTVMDISEPYWYGQGEPDFPPDFGGGGGGGEEGATAPPPIPTESDTNCALLTQDAVGTRIGPFNSRGIQDSFAVLHARAMASGIERGGVVYQEYRNGPYIFRELPGEPDSTSNCMYKPQNLPVNGTIVAFVHTHLYRDGETYTCDGAVRMANNSADGGGSRSATDPTYGDWGAMRGRQPTPIPWYTIDPESVWRLDPSVDIGSEVPNSFRWTLMPGKCARR
jgi:hypothetical protein